VLTAATTHSGWPPLVSIVRESDVVRGLRIVTGIARHAELDTRPASPLLGDLLIEMGALRRQDLAEALDRYEPARDGRFGQFLVAHSLIGAEDLQTVLTLQCGFAPTLVLNPEDASA
jgi:hypothetical protein